MLIVFGGKILKNALDCDAGESGIIALRQLSDRYLTADFRKKISVEWH